MFSVRDTCVSLNGCCGNGLLGQWHSSCCSLWGLLFYWCSYMCFPPSILSTLARVSPRGQGLWGLLDANTPILLPFSRGGLTFALTASWEFLWNTNNNLMKEYNWLETQFQQFGFWISRAFRSSFKCIHSRGSHLLSYSWWQTLNHTSTLILYSFRQIKWQTIVSVWKYCVRPQLPCMYKALHTV